MLCQPFIFPSRSCWWCQPEIAVSLLTNTSQQWFISTPMPLSASGVCVRAYLCVIHQSFFYVIKGNSCGVSSQWSQQLFEWYCNQQSCIIAQSRLSTLLKVKDWNIALVLHSSWNLLRHGIIRSWQVCYPKDLKSLCPLRRIKNSLAALFSPSFWELSLPVANHTLICWGTDCGSIRNEQTSFRRILWWLVFVCSEVSHSPVRSPSAFCLAVIGRFWMELWI